MKILENVKKIPGGLMVIPLLLGTIINTFFGHSILGMTETGIWDYFSGTFTVNLFQAGAMPLLAAFLFCNGTTIDFKKAGQPVYKGVILIITKVGIGIAIGLLVNKFIGPAGILGLTPLAIIGALSNSNGGLYAALAGEYRDATDVSACAILALKDGPFFTMLALGAAGVAKIPIEIMIGCIIPIAIGCILGNIDEDIRKFCVPGASMLIPFFAFPLGANLNLMDLVKAGIPGILLGIVCTFVTGLGGYFVYKLLKMEHPEVGAAIGTTAGNAAETPAAVAAIDSTLLAISATATAQITAAIIVTTLLCPLLTTFLHKHEERKKCPSPSINPTT